MMSFGFEDQGYVCISIETRKEKGEGYSEVKGFFKQYELLYVVGHERDLVRLRTNFKNEDVYLYRLKAEPQVIRSVFLDYLKQINRLNEHPKWYNALTHNCTTTILGHTEAYTEEQLRMAFWMKCFMRKGRSIRLCRWMNSISGCISQIKPRNGIKSRTFRRLSGRMYPE